MEIRAEWKKNGLPFEDSVVIPVEFIQNLPISSPSEVCEYIRTVMMDYGIEFKQVIYVLTQGLWNPYDHEIQGEFDKLRAEVESRLEQTKEGKDGNKQ